MFCNNYGLLTVVINVPILQYVILFYVYTYILFITGKHEFGRKSERNAAKRRRTENAPRSNRLLRRN